MGAKKKVTSKTEQPPTIPSREVSSIDIGFTLTGNLEVDFPEGMKKHCDPHPRVVLIDESHDENDEEKKDEEKSMSDKYEEQKPKLIAICRSETEGKNINKYIIGLSVKNWQFRPSDAKVLSQCLEKHDRIETVQFVRSKLNKAALDNLHLPNSVKFLSVHLNDLSDQELIEGLMTKGPPHLGLQYNNIGPDQCSIIAEIMRKNEVITTLNLSGNRIGDRGARLLSRAILFNKKLAALSMQNCNLTDDAARDLAQVLSKRVEMSKEEIFRWRCARMELIVASNSQLQLTIHPTKQKRPGSEHSSQTGKESRKHKRQTVNEKPEKVGKGAGKRKSNANVVENKVASSPKIPDPNIPDETGIERINGKMYTPGNKTLYSLNLAHNKIQSGGIIQILKMLKEHCEGEQKGDPSSTMLHHVKLDSNCRHINFEENSINQKLVDEMIHTYKSLKLTEVERFANIVSGLNVPLMTGSTSSLRSNPRLNEIKEEN